jgi:hypothetical protein
MERVTIEGREETQTKSKSTGIPIVFVFQSSSLAL